MVCVAAELTTAGVYYSVSTPRVYLRGVLQKESSAKRGRNESPTMARVMATQTIINTQLEKLLISYLAVTQTLDPLYFEDVNTSAYNLLNKFALSNIKSYHSPL